MFVGSDALALAPLTRRIAYLEEGDWAVRRPTRARASSTPQHRPVERAVRASPRVSGAAVGQGQLPPLHGEGAARAPGGAGRHAAPVPRPEDAGGAAAAPALRPGAGAAADDHRLRQRLPRRRWSGATGSRSWRALPVDADVASELRYRDPPLAEGGGAILVSQSGETADTMAALQLLRAGGQRVLSVVNVPESSMARESDGARADGGRAGDRRRLHQGLHRAARGAGLPGDRLRPGAARAVHAGRGAADPGAAGGAGQRRRGAGAGRADPRAGGRGGQGARRAVPRPRRRSSRSRWKAR